MVRGSEDVESPYFAVIFSSRRTQADPQGYAETAQRMEELAATYPGYLGIESARGADGVGITVSYWKELQSIRAWREDVEHRVAQQRGREVWYEWYRLRICRVETTYERMKDFDELSRGAEG